MLSSSFPSKEAGEKSRIFDPKALRGGPSAAVAHCSVPVPKEYRTAADVESTCPLLFVLLPNLLLVSCALKRRPTTTIMLRSAEHTLHTCKRRAVPPHILPPVFRFNLISIRLASSTPFPWTPENVREHGTVSPPLPLERTNAKRPLEAIEAALKLPVPTSFPESKDKRLRQLLLDNKDESDGQCDEFRSSYSPRRLEWLGDRILGEIAAETLFVLAPRVVKVTQSSSRAEFITTYARTFECRRELSLTLLFPVTKTS